MKLLVAAAILALNFYVYHYLASVELHPPRSSFADFPLEIGEWRCPGRETMEQQVIDNLGVTDYLICTFGGAARSPVGVYVGYHQSQVQKEGGGRGETRIHPPAHCLPGSGWDIIDARNERIDLPGLPKSPAPVKRIVIAKGDQRQLVYYWYQERGRVIADDWRKIIDLFWDRARLQRTDGALVRFTIPIFRGDEATAEAAFRDLAANFVPKLPDYVPN